jgi:hypothetical protein
MRVREITLYKEYKIGLPSYSNMTVGISQTWEIKEDEQFDFNKAWDIINQQLNIQTGNIDQSWITKGETKKDYKVTIKTPKS